MAEGAKSRGMSPENIFIYEDSQSAGADIQNKMRPGDVVLVKGSQYVRMERAVLEIMQHPEQAEQLLVRQDAAWKNR